MPLNLSYKRHEIIAVRHFSSSYEAPVDQMGRDRPQSSSFSEDSNDNKEEFRKKLEFYKKMIKKEGGAEKNVVDLKDRESSEVRQNTINSACFFHIAIDFIDCYFCIRKRKFYRQLKSL
ncbi:MAG: hypothetical protein MHMPM18_003541 [Marteilia pararefringens]